MFHLLNPLIIPFPLQNRDTKIYHSPGDASGESNTGAIGNILKKENNGLTAIFFVNSAQVIVCSGRYIPSVYPRTIPFSEINWISSANLGLFRNIRKIGTSKNGKPKRRTVANSSRFAYSWGENHLLLLHKKIIFWQNIENSLFLKWKKNLPSPLLIGEDFSVHHAGW